MKRYLWLVFLLLLSSCSAAAETLLFSDNFDSGSIAAGWGEGLTYRTENYAVQTTFVSTPAQAGAKAGHYYLLAPTDEQIAWQAGMGATAMTAITGNATTSEVYFQWYEYYATGFPFAVGAQKVLRFGYGNASFPASKKEVNVMISGANNDVSTSEFCGLWGDSSLCNVDHAKHSDLPLALNTWIKFGAWIKLNTPGLSDGFFKLYINDALYLDDVNLDMRGTDTKGFDFMWLGGNCSNQGPLLSSGSRYIDSVSWYDTQPTGESTTTTTVPIGTSPGSLPPRWDKIRKIKQHRIR